MIGRGKYVCRFHSTDAWWCWIGVNPNPPPGTSASRPPPPCLRLAAAARTHCLQGLNRNPAQVHQMPPLTAGSAAHAPPPPRCWPDPPPVGSPASTPGSTKAEAGGDWDGAGGGRGRGPRWTTIGMEQDGDGGDGADQSSTGTPPIGSPISGGAERTTGSEGRRCAGIHAQARWCGKSARVWRWVWGTPVAPTRSAAAGRRGECKIGRAHV